MFLSPLKVVLPPWSVGSLFVWCFDLWSESLLFLSEYDCTVSTCTLCWQMTDVNNSSWIPDSRFQSRSQIEKNDIIPKTETPNRCWGLGTAGCKNETAQIIYGYRLPRVQTTTENRKAWRGLLLTHLNTATCPVLDRIHTQLKNELRWWWRIIRMAFSEILSARGRDGAFEVASGFSSGWDLFFFVRILLGFQPW